MRARQDGHHDRRLASVSAFAHRWHRGVWAASLLPSELGVGLVWQDGAVDVLGAARCSGVIALSGLVRDTPLYTPTLLHEAAHVLLRHDFGLCSDGWLVARAERQAWLGAALLGIPRGIAARVIDGQATITSAAACMGVPTPLVALRVALELRQSVDEQLAALDAWIRAARHQAIASAQIEARREALAIWG